MPFVFPHYVEKASLKNWFSETHEYNCYNSAMCPLEGNKRKKTMFAKQHKK